jgi:hypothetical protein
MTPEQLAALVWEAGKATAGDEFDPDRTREEFIADFITDDELPKMFAEFGRLYLAAARQ